MNCLSSSPRMIGSRGTQTKFVCRIVKNLCAKFGAFFRSVTIFSLNHLTKLAMFLFGAYHEYLTSSKNIGNTKKNLNGYMYVPIKMKFAPFTWITLFLGLFLLETSKAINNLRDFK